MECNGTRPWECDKALQIKPQKTESSINAKTTQLAGGLRPRPLSVLCGPVLRPPDCWRVVSPRHSATRARSIPIAPAQNPNAQAPPVLGPHQYAPGLPYQLPTLENRRRTPEPPPPPFVLSAAEAAELDRVLAAWEQRNKEVHSFECTFHEWVYDPTFKIKKPGEDPNGPLYVLHGEIKYAAPDKGFFKAEGEKSDDPKEQCPKQQWICDGKSIFEYDWTKRQVTVYLLPPEAQGKAISDGPLPFVFNSDAKAQGAVLPPLDHSEGRARRDLARGVSALPAGCGRVRSRPSDPSGQGHDPFGDANLLARRQQRA